MEQPGKWDYVFIMAAKRHAIKVAQGRVARYDAALVYLDYGAAQMRSAGRYELAAVMASLARRVRRYKSVQAVIQLLAPIDSDLTSVHETGGTPASNTGVNSEQLSILEGYIGNEH